MLSAKEPRRCPTHRVVLDPLGRCALCSRAARPPHQFLGLVGGGLLIGAAFVASAWFYRAPHGQVTLPAETSVAPASIVAPPNLEDDSTSAETTAPDPYASPDQDPWASAFGSPDASADTKDARAVAVLEEGDDASDGAEPPSEERAAEIQEAMRRVLVKVYVTPDCPLCTRTVNWLRARRFLFEIHDVESNPIEHLSMLDLNASDSVPTLDIDGAGFTGFSPSAIEAALRRAAEARLSEEAATM